jgi:molybdopterin molybdotransferase
LTTESPKGKKYLIDVDEAVARVLDGVARLPVETVARDAAAGRVLATSVRSKVALPPWRNAAMDGYAVRAGDLATLPTKLRVVEDVAAGRFPTRSIGAGEATRIMTGAPVPDGADTVIRVEDTDAGRETVEIRGDRDSGKNVRPRGEDIAEGAEALAAGATIGAAQLGVLAAIGARRVDVYRAPKVAILSSGDELVPPEQFDEVAAGRKIVSSNGVTLTRLVRDAGGEPLNLGIAADTKESLRQHLERARDADLIITSGGISVGEFDYVRDVVAELGASLDFWRVRMRPGAPVGFGTLGTSAWLGLPGNPVSTMVTFELFARPAIRKMRGHTQLLRATVAAKINSAVSVAPDLQHFLRVVLSRNEAGETVARLTGTQSSGVLSSMARANALLIVPRGMGEVAAGTELRALPLSADGVDAVMLES